MLGAKGAQTSVGGHAGLCPGLGPGPEAARYLGAAGTICDHLDGPASVMPAQPDAGSLTTASADLEAVLEGPSLQLGLVAQQGG